MLRPGHRVGRIRQSRGLSGRGLLDAGLLRLRCLLVSADAGVLEAHGGDQSHGGCSENNCTASFLRASLCFLVLRQEWGMTDFENEEHDRPTFTGTKMKSFVTGKEMTYFPSAEKSKRTFFSYFLISLMVLLVIACVACIFVMKFYMLITSSNGTVNSLGGPVTSVANAVQIQLLNYFYSELAVWLTLRENHRTDTQYEDALITKLFAFQFINSYASFFYIAFIKKLAGDPCQYNSCMAELSMSLAIVFGNSYFCTYVILL